MTVARNKIRDRIAEVFEPLFGLPKAEAQTRADGFLRLALSRGWDLIVQPSWYQTPEEKQKDQAAMPATAEIMDILSTITHRLVALEAQPRTNALAGVLDALEAKLQRAVTTLRESSSDAIAELASRATDNETHDRDFDARLNIFARELSAMREDIRKCAELAGIAMGRPADDSLVLRLDNAEKRINEIGVDHLNTGEALTKLEKLLQDAVTQRLGDALPALENRLQELEKFTTQIYESLARQTKANKEARESLANKVGSLDANVVELFDIATRQGQRIALLESWVKATEANGR
jgi:hypothetical protein